MSNLIIPNIMVESDYIKKNRIYKTIMISVVVIGILFYMTIQNNNFIFQNNNMYPEYMTNIPDTNTPVVGKYIQILNNNKKYIPINKIVVIDTNRTVIPIYNKTAKVVKMGKNGVIFEYTLPKLTNISQVIIDVDLFDKRSENISTAQVRIRDNDYDTIWTSKGLLPLSRYIELNIVHPKFIYPIPQQKLDNNLTKIQQDDRLNFMLMKNTWN